MGFDKSGLTAWRAAVDGAFGDQIQTALSGLAAQGLHPRAPELKQVPAPYDKDHRHADLLRRKALAVWREIPASNHDRPLENLTRTYTTLCPRLDLLATAV